MNKLHTARLLMTATILLIIAFQAYWLHRLYVEEDGNFKKGADIIFRETMYRLQSERYKKDTMIFRGLPDDNLFMTDIISNVRKIGKPGDSGHRKMIISVKTGTAFPESTHVNFFKKDTVMYVNTNPDVLPPAHIRQFLDSNKILTDTIPVKSIDSLYHILLAKEGITLGYRVQKNGFGNADSATASFYTKKIPVGFLSPVFYQAVFEDSSGYVMKKISLQLALSLLLIGFTTVSFIFIYRSLLAQKRLTAIKNDFINNITHELKTPIATVNVAIEALRNFGGLQSPERTKEYLDISALELQRLSMLVDKVLKLSMFENQEIALQKESFDIHLLVKEVMASMKLQFDKQQATTALELSGNNFTVEADRLHITSVIYNLLDNALKYSGEKAHITVHILDQSKYLELRVSDNGIGIAPEYRDKIFEQFFRVPDGDRHNIKGYGLGLSYVSHIVKRHMGFIELETAVGKGSTFIIKIPFAEAPVIYDSSRRIIKESIQLL